MNLYDFQKITNLFPTTPQMPVLFVGHGNPMNAIEDNEFSKTWQKIGQNLPKPYAILCISAHWETQGTKVTVSKWPKTIHDFGGFPDALYQVQYPAPGHEPLALATQALLDPHAVALEPSWGLDHGCWSVLVHMFPHADVPVIQLSLDKGLSPEKHADLASQLYELRKKGVLIIASGNIVHNLRTIDFYNPNSAFDWALSANQKLKSLVQAHDLKALMAYEKLGTDIQYAIPTPDHYIPLLYAVGVARGEGGTLFNDHVVLGSISMTSIVFGSNLGRFK